MPLIEKVQRQCEAAMSPCVRPCDCDADEEVRIEAFIKELAEAEGYAINLNKMSATKATVESETKAYRIFEKNVRDLLKKHNLVF